jgi:hypothetical protein
MPRPDTLRASYAHKLAPGWEKTRGKKITEGGAQEVFAASLGRLLVWIETEKPGWRVRPCEIGVQPRRTGIDEENKFRRNFTDTVHRASSFHYSRRAADLNLFVCRQAHEHIPVLSGLNDSPCQPREFLTSSEDLEWQELAYQWLSYHDNNRSGVSIPSGDSNHISTVRFPGEGI